MERAARHKSIYAAVVCAVIALFLAAAPVRANITWEWSFYAVESGTFVTNGTLVDGAAPAGSYTTDPDSLEVVSSCRPSLVGMTFMQNQTPQGFEWDGSAATEFWRDGGTYTNGVNFFLTDWSYQYGFGTFGGFLKANDATVSWGEYLTLQPVPSVRAPVPGSIGLVVMGLLSIRRLRSR